MNRTRIEWCDFSWNPVVGCTGTCPYCYARKMAHRFHRDFTPHWVEKNFNRAMPNKPSRIFVNSMSDLADWEPEWFDRVTTRIATHPEHLFLFLSKRPWSAPWTSLPNAMLGYSATNEEDLFRCAEKSRPLMGDVTFLSLEPLHGPIRLTMEWLPRWILVGAETGNRKEKIVPDLEWLCAISRFARHNSIPLFFKESLREVWLDPLPQEYPA